MVAVPGRSEELIAESQDQQIFDHLLSQIVVNAEDLFLPPVRLEGLLKRPGGVQIATERLLDLNDAHQHTIAIESDTGASYNQPGDSPIRVAVLFEVLRDSCENTRRQGHVE